MKIGIYTVEGFVSGFAIVADNGYIMKSARNLSFASRDELITAKADFIAFVEHLISKGIEIEDWEKKKVEIQKA